MLQLLIRAMAEMAVKNGAARIARAIFDGIAEEMMSIWKCLVERMDAAWTWIKDKSAELFLKIWPN